MKLTKSANPRSCEQEPVLLIGERLVFHLPYRRWIYLAAVAAFVIVHTGHAYHAYKLVKKSEWGRPTIA